MVEKLFTSIRDCLIRIPVIVEQFYMQRYYSGAEGLKGLFADLQQIDEILCNREFQNVLDKQTFCQILAAIMDAQEKMDYIMVADILESDLSPFLQAIQLGLAQEVKEEEYYHTNLEWFQNRLPVIYEALIQKDDCPEERYLLMYAVNGQRTIKYIADGNEICLHSILNPKREAELLVRQYEMEEGHAYFVFGMGLGYHVKEILDASVLNRVTVLEYDICVLKLAARFLDLSTYLREGRLHIIYEPSVKNLLRELKNGYEKKLMVHWPSLQRLPSGMEKELLEEFCVSTNSIREQKKNMDDNFLQLKRQHLPECHALQQLVKEKSLIIVGAGPSLDIEIENLKQLQEGNTIMAVGRCARRLMECGIKPDLIVITDAWENMYRQIEGCATADIPLILLSTASAEILNYYAGPVYVAYQKGYLQAEQAAKEEGYELFHTGGSVITLALDIGIRFNAGKIVLVGTDMAYTGNQTHADGMETVSVEGWQLRRTECVGGGEVVTGKNLDIYRKWIERRIEGLQSVKVYNTSHGARIKGTIETGLFEALKNYE